MASENLTIVVNERGARVVKGRLADIGKGAKQAEGGVMLLRRALGVLAGAAVIRSLVRTADAFTNIQNRLRLVTEGTAQLNSVQNELLAISGRTRSAFEVNADLFNRLALSTKELGLTQRDVLQLTESLNQAVIISGASATEASAGLIQLSQGLASGALRGDELRSVLEQLPAVADVIAKELGVTRGELREMGQEGKITAEIVTRAFANAREELNDRFGKTVPTIGQGFQVLRNNVVNFVGRLAQAIGLTGGFAQILTQIGEGLGDVTNEFVEGALAIREFVEVGTVAIATFVDNITPRLASARAEVVKFFAALFRDEETFAAAFDAQREFTDDIDANLARLDAELDAIARNAAARREATFAEDESSLDNLLPGGSTAVATINEIDDATQKLIESQEDLFQQLLLEEEALAQSIASGEDFNMVLDRMTTNAIAAQTGMQGLAFDINETRAEIARLRQQQENSNFLQGLIEENAAMQVSVATGRELTQVLEEMALARQFEGDDEGLARALDLSRANERLRDQLDESESAITDFLTRARENAQDILAGALENAFTGGFDNVLTEFSQLLLKLASQFLASEIFRLLGQMGQGGAGGGGIIQSALGFFGGNFNTGGQFTVPNVGGGGPDSVPTLMNLTPRETVTITPAGQQPGQGQAAAAPPQVNVDGPTIINTIEDSDIVAAFNRGGGGDVILNNVTENASSYRNALGIG